MFIMFYDNSGNAEYFCCFFSFTIFKIKEVSKIIRQHKYEQIENGLFKITFINHLHVCMCVCYM